jgi:tRNA(fMet)-specific endonuclease VapC
MLDTDICIYLMNESHPSLKRRLRQHRASSVCISVITAAELAFGVEASTARERNAAKLARLRAEVKAVPFEGAAIDEYGRLRTALQQRGTLIGPLDTLIAAHALSLGATLVTNNVAEFRRAKGLAIENWATE